MAQDLRIYNISIQPDISKTLDDPGVITDQIQLSFDALAGILNMAYVLFIRSEEMDQHISIQDYESAMYLRLPDHGFERGPHLVSHMNDRIKYGLQRGPWKIAIENPLNDELQHNITMQYSCVFESIYPLDSPLKEIWILQFDDLEFLRGAISVCQWFNLDPHDHIYSVHFGNTFMDFTF